MLYIITNKREYQWHVGEPTPNVKEDIVAVQADGDELDRITKDFDNIPCPKHKRVVRWFGEMATFIARNL
jgi:hypothetical protein